MADVPPAPAARWDPLPALPPPAERIRLRRLLADARAQRRAVHAARLADRAMLKELGMPDFPDETPTEELDQEASIQTQLAALRQELAYLPIALSTVLARRSWAFLLPYLVGTVMGALVGRAILLTAHHLYDTSPLDMKRHLWDVATPAEQEQILTILVRGTAPLPRILELAGPSPAAPEPPATEALQ